MHNTSNDNVIVDPDVYQYINQNILPLVHYSQHEFWRDFNRQYANYKNKVIPISTNRLTMKLVQGDWFGYPFESSNEQVNKENLCRYLDNFFPLFFGSHGNVKYYKIVDSQLVAMLDSWTHSSLKDANQCIAFGKNRENPESILLQLKDKYILLQFDTNEKDGLMYLKHNKTFIRSEQSILLHFDVNKSVNEKIFYGDVYKKLRAFLSLNSCEKLEDKLKHKTLYKPDGSLFELPIKHFSLVIQEELEP